MSTATETTLPPKKVGWIAQYGLLYLGINVAWAAPSQLLIANQVASWNPSGKEGDLAWIMALGGVASILVTPLAGRLSDRTRSRLGRRTPWILLGSGLAAVFLVLAGLATGFGQLVAIWIGFQIALALPVVAAQALSPDQVPERQYGVVSGAIGVAYTLAIVVGTLLAEALGVFAAYLTCAVVLLMMVAQYVLTNREPSTATAAESALSGPTAATATRPGARESSASPDATTSTQSATRPMWESNLSPDATVSTQSASPDATTSTQSASRYATISTRPTAVGGPPADWRPTGGSFSRDFRTAWLSRLLVTLGNTVALFYLLFFLRDQVKYDDPDLGLLILTGIYAVCVLVAAPLAGRASDRVGRRVPFVAMAAFGVALACLVMAFASIFAVVAVAAAVLGASWGVFTAVDQALINEVLVPDARGVGMGVMQVAVLVPNAASPLLAYAALTLLGGYPGLYGFAAALVVAGAMFVYRVRTVP